MGDEWARVPEDAIPWCIFGDHRVEAGDPFVLISAEPTDVPGEWRLSQRSRLRVVCCARHRPVSLS